MDKCLIVPMLIKMANLNYLNFWHMLNNALMRWTLIKTATLLKKKAEMRIAKCVIAVKENASNVSLKKTILNIACW